MLNKCKKLLTPQVPLRVEKVITKTMSDNALTNFEPIITNLEDYAKLIKEKVEIEQRADEKVLKNNFLKIDKAARDTIWNKLFNSGGHLTKDQQEEIGKFLKEVKMNAGFHSPWDYNEWIVKVRDELLKREMFGFWRQEIVKKELGPCTYRDSDYMERSECGDISSFYAHAGCMAPFAGFETRIKTTEDYSKIMDLYVQGETVEDDELQTNYQEISEATRKLIWDLLFKKSPADEENLEVAAKLLEKHRPDAAFYGPWDYNTWIVTVRDELLKRNMLDFWRNVIVAKELGLIWAQDSDYFDNMEDPAPAQFYEYAGCTAPFKKD